MATTANAATTTPGSAIARNEVKPQSQKPIYTRFSQQEMHACKPLMTPARIVAVFMTVGVVFIPIGIATLLASTSVVELVDHYGHACLDNSAAQVNQSLRTREERISFIKNPSNPKNCTRTIRILKLMKQPIYMYYEITNFHQNHHRYVKSKSEPQLQGQQASPEQLKICAPEDSVGGQPVIPCGLVAWSFFNDTYSLALNNGTSVPVNKKGIAWKSDMDKVSSTVYASNFQNNNPSAYIGGGKLPVDSPLRDNEDLWVWMRPAALSKFRKLWGRIERDLYPGDELQVNIQNVYNCFSFNGQKKLVLSTTSWMGGKNNFVGTAYLTIGLLCVALAIGFFFMYYSHPRPLGNTKQFSWNNEKQVKQRGFQSTQPRTILR
ncbi:ALA-interacting subunit 5 [Physcomitrium patens]|uniref:ALA-interacting subunit n=1 Tax=Physcomitrium patens TaxID=3218 RepID=A9TD09_PHYPA|nr:hypothetical protein PHYPA_019893 [Physcomitrium patens]